MAHFAKLDDNNIVLEVLVVDNSVLMDNGSENEQLGVEFLAGITGYSKWKQTSYNGKFRGMYAGQGYTYDESADRFIPPRPHPSWAFNSGSNMWEPPVPYPMDGSYYVWDEDTIGWKFVSSSE